MHRAGLLLACVATAALGCVNIQLPVPGTGPLREAVVEGESGPKIALVDLSGPISSAPERGTFGLGARQPLTARIREQLQRAAKDDDVAAVLLRIDSPGGTVIASDILYREIMRFKKDTGRPVVAQLMGLGTSGAYYVAMAADQVRAYPGTVTGSIGVILFGLNMSDLMEKVGISDQSLTSGAFKAAGSPFRPMRPAERQQMQGVVDDLFQGFLGVVEAGRPKLTRARIEELADGRIYSARQALELGLVDALGDLPEAVEATKAAAGVTGEARVVSYYRSGRPPENLFSAAAPPSAQPDALDGWLRAFEGPAFLYLWRPGLIQ